MTCSEGRTMAAVSSSLNPHMQVVKEVYLIKCMFMYVHVLFVFLSLLACWLLTFG